MLKNIDPSDKSIKPFKVFKNFTLTNISSGSGHLTLKAVSGSIHNFMTGSAASQSFGRYVHASGGFEFGTYYDIPNYFMIKNLYYENDEPLRTFGSNNYKKTKKVLGGSARVFTIPRNLFGEKVKPGSIQMDVTTGGVTYDLRDDGDGNIYDYNYSSSFAAYKSSSWDYDKADANGSGSQVGNAFYEHGVIVITDTGSLWNAGTDTGHDLKYKSTQTIYEYEYIVTLEPNEYNATTNISTTFERNGSISIGKGSKNISQFFPPNSDPTGHGTGSYKDEYNAAVKYEGFVTHSDFEPYLTTVGLYNDNNELLVVGKLAKPVRLSKETQTSIVVRFDV